MLQITRNSDGVPLTDNLRMCSEHKLMTVWNGEPGNRSRDLERACNYTDMHESLSSFSRSVSGICLCG